MEKKIYIYVFVFNDLVIKNCIKVLILGGMLESWT